MENYNHPEELILVGLKLVPILQQITGKARSSFSDPISYSQKNVRSLDLTSSSSPTKVKVLWLVQTGTSPHCSVS